MSTKTLRKRIALVAVSAMGFGLLTSVSAHAAHTAGTFAGTIGANGTSTVVATFPTYCADTTVVGTADAIVVPVGAVITTTLGGTFKLGVTGPLAVTTPDGSSSAVSSGGRIQVTADAGGDTVKLTATAAGSATLIYDGTTTSDLVSTSANTVYVTVVASCSNSTYSVADSYVWVQGTTAAAGTPSNVDVIASATAGASLYINVNSNNAYATAVTTGTLAASATNGALVSWSNAQATAPTKGTVSVATVTPDGTDTLRVAPASSLVTSTTTVTITHNGVAVATKTLTFYGEAASIDIVKTSSGTLNTTGNGTTTGFFLYQYKDTAGNVVPGASASLDATTATSIIGALNADKAPDPATPAAIAGQLPAAVETAIGATPYGEMSFPCGATAGTSTVTIHHTNAISAAVISKTVALTCAGGIDSYTVATDKASYNVGEIATITITAKDSKGNPVSDATVMGTDGLVSVGGGSLTKASLATDAFAGGVRTYKAQMTTAGTFNTVVSYAGTTTTSATAAYKVVDPSASSVTRGEVLAAIDKLIAAINKQIAALQKLLTKKK